MRGPADVAGEPLCVGLHEVWQPTTTEFLRIRRDDGITRDSAANPGAPSQPDPNPACLREPFSTDFSATDGEAGSWGTPDAAFVAGLPRDASALYERARGDAQGWDLRDDQTLTLLSDLARSRSPHLTSPVRAALFGAIARVPGVELGGSERNLFGESGTVVSRDEPGRGQRTDLILDPDSGNVLGTRSVALADNDLGLPAGAVIFESGARTGIVNALGERPAT